MRPSIEKPENQNQRLKPTGAGLANQDAGSWVFG
jgi:hypothetical protein